MNKHHRIQILDYPSTLGNYKPLTPEEKVKFEEMWQELRKIVAGYKVTFIYPRSKSRE